MTEPLPEPTEPAAPPLPAAAAKLERLRRKAGRWRRVYRIMSVAPLVCWTIALLSTSFEGRRLIPSMPPWFLEVTILSTAMWLPATIPFTCWRRAVAACQAQIDLQAIGLIVEGLSMGDSRGFAQGALIEMLPRLQTSDAPLLTLQHHEILNKVLNRRGYYRYEPQAALVLTILKAYEQIGTLEDLPTVEQLAQGNGFARRNKEVREAAQACLPYLQARSEQQESRQNLLRASSGSADSPDTLLRPASAAADAAPHELLRPAERDTP